MKNNNIKSGKLEGTNKKYIGTEKDSKQKIYLSAPSWDCDWYWGFGYLGNNNCHYHLDGLSKNKNLKDALKDHFDNLQITDGKIWTFCELVSTAYKLRETAEILGRGGSNYTKNPVCELIQNQEEANRINEKVLPAIFLEIEKCFMTEEDAKKLKSLRAKEARLKEKEKELKEEIKKINDEEFETRREIEKV